MATMKRSVQFLFGQHVPSCSHRIDKHFDDYYVLQFMEAGAVSLKVGEESYRLEGMHFWSSFPGPRIRFHALRAGTTWVHRYLAFRGPEVNHWIKSGLFPIKPQPAAVAEDYGRRFDELLELSRRTDRWGMARAELLLETILTELAEARAAPHHTPGWMETALTRMTSPDGDASLDQLAAETGLSTRTFRRRFTEMMGASPRAYAIACRIGHARQMLCGTEYPIKTIAERLGYRDVYFFSRQFTRATGMSPGAYRRTKEAEVRGTR
jgi:AraC-like DNA-binding protein